MSLVAEYRTARRAEDVARIRRIMALRGMAASGMPQRAIAAAMGVSQSAVSQQSRSGPDLAGLDPELVLEAGAPILKALAAEHGYSRLGVFGSLARREARDDSDIDLLVQPPPGTGGFAFARFRDLVELTLGREVDLVTWSGLKPGIDDDILREAVLL